MNVNMSPAEYEMVCKVADYYKSWPAALAHDWIMREAAAQYSAIYLSAGVREEDLGSGAGDPNPSQDAPPAPGQEERR